MAGKSLIECEARYWNKRILDGVRTHSEIIERIKKKRGEKGAEKLRLEMQRQSALSRGY